MQIGEIELIACDQLEVFFVGKIIFSIKDFLIFMVLMQSQTLFLVCPSDCLNQASFAVESDLMKVSSPPKSTTATRLKFASESISENRLKIPNTIFAKPKHKVFLSMIRLLTRKECKEESC